MAFVRTAPGTSYESILGPAGEDDRACAEEVLSGRIRAEADHVYVIPADADLSLMGLDCSTLSDARRPRGGTGPSTVFLLTGGNPEVPGDRGNPVRHRLGRDCGSKGHKGGGRHYPCAITSASAKFDGMPRSAIASGCVDLVLPPERLWPSSRGLRY